MGVTSGIITFRESWLWYFSHSGIYFFRVPVEVSFAFLGMFFITTDFAILEGIINNNKLINHRM